MERRAVKRVSKKKTASLRVVRSGDGHKQAPFKLVTRHQIQVVVDRIVESAHPEKVILFGSYAYGKPTIDSDVDFLVVMESDERTAKRAIRIERNLLDVPFPMEILVQTPSEVARRLQIGDFFIRDIIGEGRLLYERG